MPFVEAPTRARDWAADPEVVPTRDGRRVIRASVDRRVVEPIDHSDWMYSAWEPILPGARYGTISPSGQWGRVDTRAPAPVPQLDLGGLIEFELKQRTRAYRLINEYCPETRAITACYRDRGRIHLFTRPQAALAEVERLDVEERKRRES